MGLLFTGLAVYPWVEAWITGDTDEHHLLDRPRNAPVRTGIGVAGMAAYGMFWLAGGNDILATTFQVSLNDVTYFMRVAVFAVPVLAFIITKRICLSLQRADKERVLHGSESGVIVRSPDGGYSEAHQPISQGEAFVLTRHPQREALVPNGKKVGRLRRRLSHWYAAGQIPKPTGEEVAEAERHGAIEAEAETPALEGSEAVSAGVQPDESPSAH
jgi:ubiquinol-cytochrome c reductase cytochrome b subunit